jgi:hypothetical protein
MRMLLAVALSALALLPLPASAQRQNFALINRTGSTITAVNVSPVGSNSWGPNILGNQVVNDEQQLDVSFPPGITECNFDLKITYDTEDSADLRAVNLCNASRITVTYDEDEEETNFQVQ